MTHEIERLAMSEKPTPAYWIGKIVHQMIPIDRVIPHPDNPRRHPRAQITQLRASYQEFGQFRSLVGIENAETNGMVWCVAGSGTLTAMKEENASLVDIGFLPPETPTDVVEAIMAADNLLPRGGVDDQALLNSILRSQAQSGRNLAALGLGKQEADKLLSQLLAESKTAFLASVLPPSPIFQPENQEGRDLPEQLANQGVLAADPGEKWVTMSFTVKLEDRETILAALRKAKAFWTLPTQAEAMVQIMHQFVASFSPGEG
jgi:hypothetical protein